MLNSGSNEGNGGKGGDVSYKCVEGLNTLIDYRYRQHFKAKNGVLVWEVTKPVDLVGYCY